MANARMPRQMAVPPDEEAGFKFLQFFVVSKLYLFRLQLIVRALPSAGG
jgi:hypothetical protein